MLSKYVIASQHDGQPILFNSVTKQHLPASAGTDQLEAGLFLAGQEKQAILKALNANHSVLGLTIIPSWECNLRCKHCSVLNLLQPKQTERLDVAKLIHFAESYIERFSPQWITLDFVGGEPLLRAPDCLAILEHFSDLVEKHRIKMATNITTNATVDLDDTCLKFLKKLDDICISIDGNREQHNAQRIPFRMVDFDPYERAIANVNKLIDLGLAAKIRIKAAVRDEFLTKEHYGNFLRFFGEMGINVDRINYGCHHPTDHTDTDRLEVFRNVFTARPIVMPCCKWRRSSVYLIEANGDVYDLPFKWARTKLGTLDDSIDTITAERDQLIANEFVCFKDEKCMGCPVIGYCWGGCVTANPLHKGNPSAFCHQERLIEMVAEAAKLGQLVTSHSKAIPLNILENNERTCANRE